MKRKWDETREGGGWSSKTIDSVHTTQTSWKYMWSLQTSKTTNHYFKETKCRFSSAGNMRWWRYTRQVSKKWDNERAFMNASRREWKWVADTAWLVRYSWDTPRGICHVCLLLLIWATRGEKEASRSYFSDESLSSLMVYMFIKSCHEKSKHQEEG